MVYLLLVDGFEEMEALTPVDVLRRCGVKLLTVGVNDKTVTGSHNIPVIADVSFDEIDLDNMEMLILPGGPGHEKLKFEKVTHLIKAALEKGAYIASICAAPSVIGELGLLSGKKATCYPGYEDSLTGACAVSESVVRDGNFITAKGAGVSSEFAFVLAEILCGAEIAVQVKKSMQYEQI